MQQNLLMVGCQVWALKISHTKSPVLENICPFLVEFLSILYSNNQDKNWGSLCKLFVIGFGEISVHSL